MKKTLMLLIIALLMISLVACGKNDDVSESVTGDGVTTTGVVDTQLTVTEKEETKYNSAIVTLSSYNKDSQAQYFNIAFPTDEGREIRYGRGSAALDGTWVICGRSTVNETIECNSIENIYEAYVGRWEESVENMRHDSAYSDCKFVAENREMTEINGFSMCRYEGTHTYNYTDFTTGTVTPYSCYFVAYGTQLSEGGYVYWIVFDNSEDQSLNELVRTNAESMAKSLEETTLF